MCVGVISQEYRVWKSLWFGMTGKTVGQVVGMMYCFPETDF